MTDDQCDTVAVAHSEDRSICYVRIDNQAHNNVLGLEVTLELRDALRAADRDADVDGIILGSVGNTFCSDADLSEIAGGDLETGTRWLNAYYDNLELLKNTGKPTVAAVTGPCVAGGQELVMSCDLIVADESARFGQPEVIVGSTAGSGGLQMLPLMIGEQRARDLLLTGRLLDAQEAYDIGLINRLVADDEVDDRSTEVLLNVIQHSSPQAHCVMKSIMKQWSNLAMLGWESQRELTAAVWRSRESQTRADAFLDDETMDRLPFMRSSPDRDDA